MIHKIFLTPLSLLILSAACSNSSSSNESPANDTTTTSSVETKAPNTSYKPAFAGQTRIGAVTTKTAYESKILGSGLNRPWGITTLPDGRFLITEKKGTMRIATNTGTLSDEITGLPEVNSNGQGGLLGLVVDPGFATNKTVYWTFSEKTADGNVTAVAKGMLAADEKSMTNVTVIYRATPGYSGNLHYGSRILFDRSGNLVVSTGERSDLVTRPQAQSLTSGLGKVIKIKTDGTPAAGNPFLNRTDARPEIYSYGHRNVQGLALHPLTGDIWETEFGPKGGDEVNKIQAGKNYGWPTITYGVEYSGKTIGDGITQLAGMEQPIYYWDPVVSPSGMTFYTGTSIPEWENNLFIASLSGQHVLRLVLDGNKVTGEERLLSDQKERFRDITQGKDGALYAVTDGGKLYRIGRK